MAPPVPTLPEIAGTLALSFTGADAPAVQRPATPPPAATSTTSATQPPEDAGVPRPPTLPDLPGESTAPADPTVPDEPPPSSSPTTDPISTEPPQPEPTTDIVQDYPAPTRDEPIEAGPYDMPEREDEGSSKDGGLLGPTDRRYFFELFAGGTRALRGGYSYGYYGSAMDFKIEGALGGHFKGRPDLGLAGFAQASFGTLSTLTVGPRFQWDTPFSDKFAVFSHTNLTLAYRAAALGFYSPGFFGDFVQGTYHAGTFGVGWGIRAIIADRMSLTFRPVNVSLTGPAPAGVIQIDWDVFGGIGVVW